MRECGSIEGEALEASMPAVVQVLRAAEKRPTSKRAAGINQAAAFRKIAASRMDFTDSLTQHGSAPFGAELKKIFKKCRSNRAEQSRQPVSQQGSDLAA